jgi:ferredoxin
MAPQVYTVTDDGFNEMGEFEVSAALAEFAREGARACPEGAITVLEDHSTR